MTLPSDGPISMGDLVFNYGKIKNPSTNNRQLYGDFGDGVLFRSSPTTTKLSEFYGFFGVNPYHTSQGVIINEFDVRDASFDEPSSAGIALGVVSGRTSQNGTLIVKGEIIGTWAHPFTIDSTMYEVRFNGTSSTTGTGSVSIPGNDDWTLLDRTRAWTASADPPTGIAEIDGTLTIRVAGDTTNTPVGTWDQVPIFIRASAFELSQNGIPR